MLKPEFIWLRAIFVCHQRRCIVDICACFLRFWWYMDLVACFNLMRILNFLRFLIKRIFLYKCALLFIFFSFFYLLFFVAYFSLYIFTKYIKYYNFYKNRDFYQFFTVFLIFLCKKPRISAGLQYSLCVFWVFIPLFSPDYLSGYVCNHIKFI